MKTTTIYRLSTFIISLLLSSGLFAQTGPGGVGNADGSNGQPEIKLWLLPDSLGLTDGNDVLSWTDYSGNNNDLSAVSATSPVFKASAINNHDYLEFSKDNNRIIRNSFDMPSDAVAVFMVLKTADSGDGVLSYAVSGSDNEYLFYQSNSLTTHIDGSNDNSGVSYNDDSWKIFSHQWRSSDGSLYIHLDGTEEYYTTFQTGAAITSGGNLAIGGEQDDVDGGYDAGQDFDGDIAEFIMFASPLKKAQRVVIENYLAQKYGLDANLAAAGDKYVPDDASYIVSLTGMGKESDGVTEASCDGLHISQNGGFDNGEYIMTAHDGSENSEATINTSTEVTNCGVDSAWNRSWYIDKTTIDGVNAKIAFDFGEGINGDYPGKYENYRLLYRPNLTADYDTIEADTKGIQNGDQIYFALSDVDLADGYYTLGSVDADESPLTGVTGQTWYTLVSGFWDDWEVWTLDPSGSLPDNPGMEVPSSADDVVILTGKTVTVRENNIAAVDLTAEGRLDFQDYTGQSFGTISGSGRILLAADNFPGGDASDFITEGEGEGTVEYYGTSFNLNTAREFYNLYIDMDNASETLTLLKDYTINGYLRINQGILQINDNSSASNLNITVQNEINVQSNGQILTGEGNARHQLNAYGDFINNGIVKFTNRISADYSNEATNGIVDFNALNDSKNQTIKCKNTSNFYRIEIDKGTDDTYELAIEADDASYFNLFGYANRSHDDVAQLDDNAAAADQRNPNALGLYRGTVRLKSNVNVPVLNNVVNYNISEAARLWIDGGSAAKSDGTAIVAYGKIQVTNGTLNSTVNSGITIRENGLVKVEGGTLTINQLRTSVFGAENVGGYVQSGGTTNILGGTTAGDYYCFNLTYPGNVFNMSGGTLHIHEAEGKGGIFINSDEVNQNVTGGTVIFDIQDGNDFEITSKAPFWDLVIRNSHSGTGKHILTEGVDVGATDEDLAQQDLVVLNDLTIETGTTRTSGSDTYGSYLDLVPDNITASDLYVGGDLIIEDSGVLDIWKWDGTTNDGSAAVTFTGSKNAVLYVGDIATYTNALVQFKNPDDGPWPSGFDGSDETYGVWTLPFYDLIVDKPNATLSLASKLPGKGFGSPHGNPSEYRNANGGKNISRIGGWLIRITNKIAILNGTFSQIDPLSTVTMLEDDGTEFGDVGDPVDYTVAISNAQIINKDTLFVYEDGVTPKNGTIVFRIGGDLTLETTDNAFFGNLAVNTSTTGGTSYNISLTSDVKIGRLQFSGGILDIGTHNLMVDVFEFMPSQQILEESDGQAIFTTNDFIRMAGNASDGGLSVKLPRSLTLYESPTPTFPDPPYTKEFNVVDRVQYYEDGQEYNTPDRLWFPIGTDAGGSDKYTPAVMYIVDDAGVTYSGDEYVTVRLSNNTLQTTDLTGGDILSYYWNVEHEGFDGGLPDVSWIFQYDDSNISGIESDYVPGKVLDGGSYTRSTDGDETGVKDSGAAGNNGDILGTNPNNIIVFNGITGANDNIDVGRGDAVFDRGIIDNNWTTAFPGTGFTLENANYTAGEAARFVGAPDIYYSIREAGYGNVWNNTNSWYDSPTGSTHPPDFPGAGDIAVIRGDNFMDDIVVNGTRECAEVVFQREGTYVNIDDLPRLRFSPTDQLTAGKISGEGDIYLQYNMTNQPVLNADIGEFAKNDISLIHFYMTEDGLYEIDESEFFSNVPTLRIYGQLDPDRTVQYNYDLNAKNLIIDGRGTLRVGGNYTVENYTRLGENYFGILEFPNGNNSYSFKTKDLFTGNLTNGDEVQEILALPGNTNDIAHKLIVERNIELSSMDGESSSDNVVIDLYNPSPENSVILELQGEDNGSFVNNFSAANSTVELYRIIMNKGTDTTSTFTFEDNFTLSGPTSGAGVDKAIELQNGKLILNDPNINVDLTTGDDDFFIPGTAGLEVRQGTANANGNSGILLDGKLQVSGGMVDMSGGDNYIQYSASGNATLDVSSGTLTVGSQIRRGLTSTEGILNYNQSGGTVVVGNDAAPENNRGVFEILNEQSNFTHTGGTLYIVRAQDNALTASLYLNPANVSFGENTEIRIGHTSTPPSQEISIYSAVSIPNLLTDNASGNNPTAKMLTIPLTVTDTLDIQAGTEFNANGLDLNLHGDMIVNGTFTPNNNTSYFSGASEQNIYGNVQFYNLTKNTSNTLKTNADITVNDELKLLQGTFNDNGNTLNAKGDVWMGVSHISGASGNGIEFNGNLKQVLRTEQDTARFARMTINNPNGTDSVAVHIPEGNPVIIEEELKMQKGILDIGKNLIVLESDASINEVNAFSSNNMIQTNISFTDAGIKKYFPAISSLTNFTYPIGSAGKYTPVEFSIQNMDAGGYIRIKAADEIHPTVINDTEPCDEINDTSNVLKFHWLIEAGDVTNFTADANMHFHDADIQIDNTLSGTSYDVTSYIAARLLLNSTLWNKYDPNSFDEDNSMLVFSFTGTNDDGISGDYTAGIEDQGGTCEGAIPDEVPSYVTISDGSWTDETIWDTHPTAGGTVPAGGPRGSITIVEHDITIPGNYILNYKTKIDSGGVNNGILRVEETFGHRLGQVEGQGTLELKRGNLPAGIYTDFFSESGGTLEYDGNTDYDVLSEITTVNNLKFTGTGERRLPNLELQVLGNMEINGPDVMNEHNKTLKLKENLSFTSGTFDAGFGDNAIVMMNGSSAQTINGTNTFTGSNSFNHFEIKNSAGVTINTAVEISNNLSLTQGVINTDATNTFTLDNTATDVVTGGSTGSFIDGPLYKKVSDGSEFTFPVGNTGRYGELHISATSTGTPEIWEAQYYNHDPSTDGYSTDTHDATLESVYSDGYWRIKSPNSGNAKVKIRWDGITNVPAAATDREELRVALWEDATPDRWIQAGDVVTDVSQAEGYIETNSVHTFNEFTDGSYFAVGSDLEIVGYTWEGNVSADWHTPGNWSNDKVPSSSNDAEIPNVSPNVFPIITTAAQCNDLTIQADASLTINPGHSLVLNGDLSYASGSNILLKADASARAHLITKGSITTSDGTAEVELFIRKNEYSYISMPLSNVLNDDFLNAPYAPYPQNDNLYEYNEAYTGSNSDYAWNFFTTAGTAFEVGKGYAHFVDVFHTYTLSGGTFNNGDISEPIVNSGNGDPANGWNLIGNPYPSAVDADAFISANSGAPFSGTLYFWDDDASKGNDYASSDYATYTTVGATSGGGGKTPNGYIAPGQGFMIEASADGNLLFTNSMRTVQQGEFFKNNENDSEDIQTIRLSLLNNEDSLYNDILIAFTPKASYGYDKFMDGRKNFGNSNIGFYSLANDNVEYAIQALPFDRDSQVIRLGFMTSRNASHTVNLEQLENLNAYIAVYLHDKYENETIDLRTQSTYSFESEQGTFNDRFEIIFEKPEITLTTWTGEISDKWNESGNWDSGIPDIFTEARIPKGSVKADGTIRAYKIVLGSEADLTLKESVSAEVADSVILKSDAFNNARLLDLSNQELNGKIEYLASEKNRDYFISKPVRKASASMFGESNENPGILEGYVKLFEYKNEPLRIFEAATSLENLNGYIFNNYRSDYRLSFEGKINTGKIIREFDSEGAYLLGNPYPSDLNWGTKGEAAGWEGINTLRPSLWYINRDNNTNIAAYNRLSGIGVNAGSPVIPPMNAVWVLAETAGTITVDNAAREIALTDNKTSNNYQGVQLTVNANELSDETVVFFGSGHTGLDDYDTEKMFAAATNLPQIHTVSDSDEPLAINAYGTIDKHEIPVFFTSAQGGTFTMSAQVNNIDNDELVVLLEDLNTGDIIDIDNNNYTFSSAASDKENRFILHFEKDVTSTLHPDEDQVRIYAAKDNVVVDISNFSQAQVSIYDLLGRPILSRKISQTKQFRISTSGVYIVKVETNDNVKTAKVFIE